jgi:hypothetical protein
MGNTLCCTSSNQDQNFGKGIDYRELVRFDEITPRQTIDTLESE